MHDIEKMIPDLEKVIKGLECCIKNGKSICYQACPYCNDKCCDSVLMRDVLELLKAQEPKSPIVKENAYGWKFFYCPSCGREFNANRKHGCVNAENFCDKCGQAVKWDEPPKDET